MRYNLEILIVSGTWLHSINKSKNFSLSKLFLWKGLQLTQQCREGGILWPQLHLFVLLPLLLRGSRFPLCLVDIIYTTWYIVSSKLYVYKI